MYSLNDNEETIKNQVRRDFFADFDSTQCFNNIDFSVAVREEGTFRLAEREYLLWAESKAGNRHSLFDSLVQLILTIGKARTLDNNLPPHFLGAFDAEKIAFIPFHAVMEVFNYNDFNWNVTPSDHGTKEFKQLHELVKQQIEQHSASDGQVYIYRFAEDGKELRNFIRRNFVSGRDKIQRIRVNHNNFVSVFQKWRREVMPTININWDNAKAHSLLEADFFLADLIAENNRTLLDKLHVLLQDTHYELDRKIDTDGLFSSKTVQFKDRMQAHTRFWVRYARPPKEAYWDKIVARRDLLVPQDVRERKGSYFTPRQWVELSQQYIAEVLGENWQDEYYVWDCCAGTGNLLAGLTNKYHIYASTLDQADVKVMQERIEGMGEGSNLLPSHVFQFDFLNDSFDDPKLPEPLRNILTDPEKRKKLVIYINPPYAEAGSAKTVTNTGSNKAGVSNVSNTYKEYISTLGKAGRELFVQFFTRIYCEIPGAVLAEFSKLKILQAPNFADFRKIFQAKLDKLFLMPSYTFDNVKGKFPIGFFIWKTSDNNPFCEIAAQVYEGNKEPIFVGTKLITLPQGHSINEWLKKYEENSLKSEIAAMCCVGTDFQHQNYINIATSKDCIKGVGNAKGIAKFGVTQSNVIQTCIYLSVRHAIEATWLNDRDQFLYPNDGWQTDYAFQADCLAYTLFHGQNRISHSDTLGTGINHWIPFTERELDSPDCFQSHFMSEFIHRPIQPIAAPVAHTLFDNNETDGHSDNHEDAPRTFADAFTPAARMVMEAGKALWHYYLHYPQSPNAPFGTTIDVNASFYDIRVFFQGRNDKGKMNNESEDAEYMRLLRDLRQKQKALALQIQPKIYRYGFLK